MKKRPKHYRPDLGDEFIELQQLREEHKGRIFEARDQKTGEGVVGYLEDANWYVLDGVVAIRFVGEPLGIFDVPTAKILLKSPEFVLPEPEGSGQ